MESTYRSPAIFIFRFQISALENEVSLAMYSNLILGNGWNNDIGV